MEKRLLLDGVNVRCAHAGMHQGVISAAAVLAHATVSALALADHALAGAELTLHGLVGKLPVITGFGQVAGLIVTRSGSSGGRTQPWCKTYGRRRHCRRLQKSAAIGH
jgi:hypothetical protein